VLGAVFYRSRFIQLEALINGVLAGCVSVTAGADVLEPFPALLVGAVGGAVYMGASSLMLRCRLDDPLDAAPIHGACGLWGLIAVGLFANGGKGVRGLFYGGGVTQLGSQLVGASLMIAWAGGVMGSVFIGMMRADPSLLRVPIDIELQGDLVLYGGSAYPELGKEEGDPPPPGDMCVVMTDVQDSTALWGWNSDVMLEAVEAHEQLLRDNVVRFHGFEFSDEGDSLSIVFHNAFDALRFALISQLDLQSHLWPEELYAHPSGERDGLYAGLRVRMAIALGNGKRAMNRVTNRLSYEGVVVDSCSVLLKAVEDGGIVVAASGVIQQLQERFAHRLYELGQHEVQDLGSFTLPGYLPSPVSLVQIMPQELRLRPSTPISIQGGGEMLLLPYAHAPGVREMQELGALKTPIAFVFCTLNPNLNQRRAEPSPLHENDEGIRQTEVATEGDDVEAGRRGGKRRTKCRETRKEEEVEEASSIELLKRTAHGCQGYVTKASHGVSLMAFPTAVLAIQFLQALAQVVEESMEQLQLSAGLHVGVPASVHANKATGRADYLGPPVNVAARLLSLAADRRDLFGDAVSSVAVSGAAWATVEPHDQRKAALELCGKFHVKGVDDEVEAFALRSCRSRHQKEAVLIQKLFQTPRQPGWWSQSWRRWHQGPENDKNWTWIAARSGCNEQSRSCPELRTKVLTCFNMSMRSRERSRGMPRVALRSGAQLIFT